MLDYGCDTWKEHNDLLQDMANRAQAQLTQIKKDIQEVNWARKNQQTNVGERLRQLESRYAGENV